MLAKQLQGLHANLPAFLDVTTGTIKSKKQKKEKTPEDEAWVELKKLEKKPLGSKVDALSCFHVRLRTMVKDLGSVPAELNEEKVRNCSELAPRPHGVSLNGSC